MQAITAPVKPKRDISGEPWNEEGDANLDLPLHMIINPLKLSKLQIGQAKTSKQLMAECLNTMILIELYKGGEEVKKLAPVIQPLLYKYSHKPNRSPDH